MRKKSLRGAKKVLRVVVVAAVALGMLIAVAIVATAADAENCELTVQFDGVTIRNATVKDVGGNTVASCGQKTGTATFTVPKGDGYTVTLRQGDVYKTVGGIDCTGDTATVNDLVCTLTANFPGVTIRSGLVENSGGKDITSCGQKTDSAVFKVLKGNNYKVTLRQGDVYKTVGGIDCTGDTAAVGDLVCTLTANFPGVTIRSGLVENSGGKDITSCGQKTDSAIFKVLKGNNYKVTLRQGDMYKTVGGIDCTGDTAAVGDLVCTLTANFPGVTIRSGLVENSVGKDITSCGQKTDSAVFKVLKGNNYKVTLRQGDMYKTVGGIDCTGDTAAVGDLVCTLTTNFPGITIRSGLVENSVGKDITSCGQKTGSAVFKVLKGNNYKVTLRQGDMYKTVGGIDCTGDTATVNDLVCTLTVNFPGVTIRSGLVENSVGKDITSCGQKTDSVVFKVLKGNNYKVTLRVGDKYYTYTGIDCTGSTAVVGDTKLTVNYPGVKSVNRVQVYQNGRSVGYHDWTSDSTSFTLSPGLYDIHVTKGGMTYEFKDVFLLGSSVSIKVPLKTLQVNYPGVKSVNRVQVFQGGNSVEYHDWTNDTTSFIVFNNGANYDVKLQKGGMVYEGSVPGASSVLNVPILDLMVNYTGVKRVNRVQVFQGGNSVEYHDWTNDTTSFKVFDNGTDYTVKMNKGGMKYEGSVTCASPVLNVPILNLTVNYPGVQRVNRVQIFQDGQSIEYHDWTNDTTSFKVFDNGSDYTVKMNKGGMKYEGSVTCASPVLNVPILDLVVNYPNVKRVNRVQIFQDGQSIEYHDWTDDTTSFKVFDNGTDYTVKLYKGGMAYEDSVTCANPVLNVPITNLEIRYPGITHVNRVQVFQGGQSIEYHDWTNDATSFYVFQNGTSYQINITKDGVNYTYDSVMCSASSVIVDETDVMLDMGGIGGARVQFKQAGVTKYTFYDVATNEALTVKNGIYDIVITKGGMSTQIIGEICLGDETAVAVSTGTLTYEFPGIGGVRVTLTQGGSSIATLYDQTDACAFTVFDNGMPYEATFVKGGMSIAATGSAGDTVAVPVDTVAVDFAGVSGTRVTLYQGGASIYTAYDQADTCDFTVFANGAQYSAIGVKGGMSASATGDAGGTIILPTDTITIDFAGVSGTRVTLYQDGASIYTAYDQADTCDFTVFANGAQYSATGVKGGMSASAAGDAGGTITLPTDTITVDFAGISGVRVTLYQSGVSIYTAYDQADTCDFAVFANGTQYSATGVRGGMSHSGFGDAGDTIYLTTKTLTVTFSGAATRVSLAQNGSNIFTVYNVTDSVDFEVFDNGLVYEATIVQASGTTTQTLNGVPVAAEPAQTAEPAPAAEPALAVQTVDAVQDRAVPSTATLQDEALPQAADAIDRTVKQAAVVQVLPQQSTGFSMYWLILFVGLPAISIALWLVIKKRKETENQ